MNWSTVQKSWTEFKMKARAGRPEASNGQLDVLAHSGDGLAADRQMLNAGRSSAAEKKIKLVHWPTTRVVAVEGEEEIPPNTSTSWQ